MLWIKKPENSEFSYWLSTPFGVGILKSKYKLKITTTLITIAVLTPVILSKVLLVVPKIKKQSPTRNKEIKE